MSKIYYVVLVKKNRKWSQFSQWSSSQSYANMLVVGGYKQEQYYPPSQRKMNNPRWIILIKSFSPAEDVENELED